MTNREKFKSEFGLYATEVWAMPEKDFLEWLNSKAIEAEPTKHGKWINCGKRKVINTVVTELKCSECGAVLYWLGHYCPNCGAKMDEVEE